MRDSWIYNETCGEAGKILTSPKSNYTGPANNDGLHANRDLTGGTEQSVPVECNDSVGYVHWTSSDVFDGKTIDAIREENSKTCTKCKCAKKGTLDATENSDQSKALPGEKIYTISAQLKSEATETCYLDVLIETGSNSGVLLLKVESGSTDAGGANEVGLPTGEIKLRINKKG